MSTQAMYLKYIFISFVLVSELFLLQPFLVSMQISLSDKLDATRVGELWQIYSAWSGTWKKDELIVVSFMKTKTKLVLETRFQNVMCRAIFVPLNSNGQSFWGRQKLSAQNCPSHIIFLQIDTILKLFCLYFRFQNKSDIIWECVQTEIGLLPVHNCTKWIKHTKKTIIWIKWNSRAKHLYHLVQLFAKFHHFQIGISKHR